MGPTGLEPV